MRTTEAARYARWSAGIAVLLIVVVACVYGARDWQSRQARKKVPAGLMRLDRVVTRNLK